MKKVIYHGSNRIIEKPQFGFGKAYNDYGLGFYCTEDFDLAKEWSVSGDKDGFANKYELEMDGLKVLNLNEEKYSILNWLAILLENRTFVLSASLSFEAKEYILGNFLPDYKNYDVIIGYRADDSYFSYADDFIKGVISIGELKTAMHLGFLGEQIVLKSKKAFDQITYIESFEAKHEEWFPKKESRDVNARREYLDNKKNKRQKGSLYIGNIIDEEIKDDDPRLR